MPVLTITIDNYVGFNEYVHMMSIVVENLSLLPLWLASVEELKQRKPDFAEYVRKLYAAKDNQCKQLSNYFDSRVVFVCVVG